MMMVALLSNLPTVAMQDTYGQLMAFFLALLPEHIKGFVEPSVTMLVRFWQDGVGTRNDKYRHIVVLLWRIF